MKKVTFLIPFLLMSLFCFSQKETAEELEQKLIEAENDSIRTYCLKELCKRYRDSDVVKHFTVLNQGYSIAVDNDDKLYQGVFLREKAMYYKNVSKLDSAYYYFEKTISIAKQLDEKIGYLGSITSYASALHAGGDYEKASQLYYEALEVCERDSIYDGMVSCYFGLTSIYELQKKFDESLEVLNKALLCCTKLDERRVKFCEGATLSNISMIYYYKKEYQKSIDYGLQAVKLKKETNYIMSLEQTYFSIGNSYAKLEDEGNAINYYQSAFEISEKLKKPSGMARSANKLAELYLNKNNLSKAKPYLNYLEENVSIIKDPGTLRNYYRVQGQHYAQRNDFEKVQEYYKKAMAFSDTLAAQEKNKTILELETQYETEKHKREKEQAILNEKHAKEIAAKNRRLFLLALAAAILLLLAAGFYIYQQRLKKRAELAELKLNEAENKLVLERKLNDAEMKALKSQMNPHFLFNAFNSIQEYIIMNNRELASDYLGKFADLMRMYLDHSREKYISLEEEIEATKLYLELEKIRFEEKLNYEINLADDVNKSKIPIPPMLIQPFIENSLKHGLLHRKEDRQLSISYKREKDNLLCIVEDNGIGRKQSALLNAKKIKKHKSFATSATENRIDLLNIGRDKKISMKILDLINANQEAAGTKVILTIPIENE